MPTRKVDVAIIGAGTAGMTAFHAIKAKQTVTDLLAMPYYHPSIEEMLQSALRSAAQQL